MTDDLFPTEAFGDGHESVFVGQKSYNGVAVLSRRGFASRGIKVLPHAPEAQKRFLSVNVAGLQVVCVYVPNGSEVGCDKYHYKWRGCMRCRRGLKPLKQDTPFALLGDFNIALDHAPMIPLCGRAKCWPVMQSGNIIKICLRWGWSILGIIWHLMLLIVYWWDYRRCFSAQPRLSYRFVIGQYGVGPTVLMPSH